jgi:rhamnosyltransferase
MFPNVIAVVPVYNPDPDLPRRVDELSRQVGKVLLVDDGSDASVSAVLEPVKQMGHLVLFRHENGGIAAALNTGITHVLDSRDHEFVLTVDQDTILCPDYVERCVETYERARRSSVAVGLVAVDVINDRPTNRIELQEDVFEAIDPIQSGMLIPVSTILTAGLFREDFVIDCVDTEYSLRLRTLGLIPLIGTGSSVRQPFGTGRELRFLRIEKSLVSYSPLRHYYIARNRTRIYQQYFRQYPAWCLRSMIDESIQAAKSIVAGPERTRKSVATLRGLWSGMANRTGKVTGL